MAILGTILRVTKSKYPAAKKLHEGHHWVAPKPKLAGHIHEESFYNFKSGQT